MEIPSGKSGPCFSARGCHIEQLPGQAEGGEVSLLKGLFEVRMQCGSVGMVCRSRRDM